MGHKTVKLAEDTPQKELKLLYERGFKKYISFKKVKDTSNDDDGSKDKARSGKGLRDDSKRKRQS